MLNRKYFRLLSDKKIVKHKSCGSLSSTPTNRNFSNNNKNSEFEMDAAEAYPKKMKYQRVIQMTLQRLQNYYKAEKPFKTRQDILRSASKEVTCLQDLSIIPRIVEDDYIREVAEKIDGREKLKISEPKSSSEIDEMITHVDRYQVDILEEKLGSSVGYKLISTYDRRRLQTKKNRRQRRKKLMRAYLEKIAKE
ncbi:unnamed protein product [Moneuplotes crassus]|uniref:Uncharacterized protein n=1 Tax=Euplotes crassus TaxID=5936 RepID=A0AAD1XWI0_EUPCR|nr:unnamed protein product [Moneuplotes crassus]